MDLKSALQAKLASRQHNDGKVDQHAAAKAGKPEQKYPVNLYAVGRGVYGRLAQGDEQSHSRFVKGFASQPNVEFGQLACGAGHVLVITAVSANLTEETEEGAEDKGAKLQQEEGLLYSWGKCHFGQLGLGQEDEDRHLPTPVIVRDSAGHTVRFKQVACGDSFSLAISEHGELYSWGCGYYGPLGHGEQTSYSQPKLVEALCGKTVVAVTGGAFHTIALLADGTVYAFGRNERGQLGLGDTLNRNVPTPVPDLRNVAAVAAGHAHSLCVTTNGKVYAWGSNEYHQLGLSDQEQDVLIPVEVPLPADARFVNCKAGKIFSLLLDDDGGVYSTGYLHNFAKEPHTKKIVAIACGETHKMAISEKGSLYTWGDASFGKLGRTIGSSADSLQHGRVNDLHKQGVRVVAVAGGANHTLCLVAPS
ncbi:WD repeat-containing protein 11 [Balamuthia mandrillaris]